MAISLNMIKKSKVERNSLGEQVHDYILNKIYSKEYLAGTRLKEKALAEEIGVSHIPVREALRRLEQANWVTIIPFRGAFVKKLGPEEIKELYDIRARLEALAVSVAIEKMDQKTLNMFKVILEKETELVTKPDEWIKQRTYENYPDLKFHSLIIDTAGYEQLKSFVTTCDLQARSIEIGRIMTEEDRRRSNGEHWALLEAIEDQDAERGENIIKEHILRAKESALRELVKNGELVEEK